MTRLREKQAALLMALRGQGITDTAVLNAIEAVPREFFIPTALRQHAYDDVSLPIALGQSISQPIVVARMTAALALTGKERVLEIGTGSGYQAAILSHLCRRVYTIERLRPLLVEADRLMGKIKVTNYTSKHGDGALGWPEAAPFDRIIVTCAAPHCPPALLEQLKIGGILIAPIGQPIGGGGAQYICRFTKDSDGALHQESLFMVKFIPLVSDLLGG